MLAQYSIFVLTLLLLLSPNVEAQRNKANLTGKWQKDVTRSDDLEEFLSSIEMMKQRRPKGPLRMLLSGLMKGRQPSDTQKEQMIKRLQLVMRKLFKATNVGSELLDIRHDDPELTFRSGSKEATCLLDGQKRRRTIPNRQETQKPKHIEIKAHWNRGRPRIEYDLEKIKVCITYRMDKSSLFQETAVTLKRPGKKFRFNNVYINGNI